MMVNDAEWSCDKDFRCGSCGNQQYFKTDFEVVRCMGCGKVVFPFNRVDGD